MVAHGVRGRSWLAVVALLGLVGSLLAVGAGPAGGVEGEADNEAVYSACVGAALDSAGLLDVVGTFAEDAVNCLAHFGVTRGRTATTYDPGSPVLRWQMALFLSRAAGPAGIALPANPVAVFTDIGGFPESTRTAVNQMAALDIMPALRGTAFEPSRAVSRAEMASMLDAFLVAAEKGSGLGLGALGADTDALADVAPDDAVFDDIANVTRGEYSAIRRMFELGVARGTGDDRFSPSGLVTRAQMAVFITRMLAHTVARPRGITLQASESSATEGESVDLVVSVRDTSLMGVPDALVDVFSSSAPDDAFGEDGRCSADDVSAVGGSGVCEISLSDEATDPSGDLEASTTNLDASTTLWAWTGDNGDRYDADDTVGSSIAIKVSKAGTKLRVTDDMPEGANSAEFGDRVMFTLQVVDEDGNPVAKKDEAVTVAAAETVTTAGDNGTSNTSSSTRAHMTDASGKIELSFRHTDPRSGSGNTGDSARLNLYITLASGSSLTLEDKTNLEKAGTAGTDAESASAVWRDSTPVPTTLMLSQTAAYHEASAEGNGAVNVVTAKLTDQFGNPVSRQTIHFTSDDPMGVGQEASDVLTATLDVGVRPWRVVLGLLAKARYTRTTNRLGAATLTYHRDDADDRIETITARFVRNQDDATVADTDDRDDLISEKVYHYWTVEPAGGVSGAGRVLHIDSENNRIVFSAADSRVMMVGYDSNDQFNNVDGPTTAAGFEKALAATGADAAAHLTLTGYSDSAKGVSRLGVSREWPALERPDSLLEDADGNLVLGGYGEEFAIDGGVIAVGAPDAAVGSTSGAGKVFVYNGAGDASPAVLTAPTPAEDAEFGFSVAVRGDTIVVGEPKRLGAAAGRTSYPDGAVYVFTKPAGGWEGEINTAVKFTDEGNTISFPQPTTVSASYFADNQGHAFGWRVAISGDEKVIAAGAPKDKATCGGKGSVLLFIKPAGGWAASDGAGTVQLAGGDCTALNPSVDRWLLDNSDRFGQEKFALDQTGDTVVVGAALLDLPVRADDNTYTAFHDDAGAAYVFRKPAGGWSTTALTASSAQLISPAPTRRERVGKSVGVSSDGNTVVVAANGRATRQIEGKALVFTAPEGGWAASGDWSARLGDIQSSTSATSAAAARTTVIGSVLNEPAELVGPDGRRYGGELFGQWVDITRDGAEIIASRGLRSEGGRRGSLHIFTRPEDGWADSSSSVEYLGPAPDATFGWGAKLDRQTGSIAARTNINDDEVIFVIPR